MKFLIPVMLMVILVYTIFSPQIGEIERQAKIKTRTFYIIFGLGLGFYDGFFGPGAGSFWTFSFIGVLGIGMKKAVAHTKVLNFVSSMASLIVFIVAGNILYKIGFLMAVSQIIGGYLGSNMVIKKEVKFIKTMFLAVVGVTIIKIICDFYR